MQRFLAGFVRRLLICVLLPTPLLLPAQATLDTPILMELGPAPSDPDALCLAANGRLSLENGAELGAADRADALRQRAPWLRLRAHRRTPARVLQALLEECPAAGITAVDFLARLPDGRAGSFHLALPPTGVIPDLSLSLHDRRPGVPPASVTPVLQRFVRGLALNKLDPMVVAVEMHPAASCEQCLATLLAVSRSGVRTVVWSCGPGTIQPAAAMATRPTDLVAMAKSVGAGLPSWAMDLGPRPLVAVRTLELPQPKPEMSTQVVGCPGGDSGQVLRGEAPGLGGRYGSRHTKHPAGLEDAITLGLQFLQRQQLADGSLAGGEFGDTGATSLAVLAALGCGSHLDAGQFADLVTRGVGALLASQQPDGALPGCVQEQALAALALVETYLLSGASRPLVHAAAIDALDWLVAQQASDGSFGSGPSLPTGDTLSTAAAVLALASAEVAGLPVGSHASDLMPWLNRVAEPTGQHRRAIAPAAVGDALVEPTAAAVFARYFAGQSHGQVPILEPALNLLLVRANPEDPFGCYWTTYALFQRGERHWAEWSKNLGILVVAQLKDGEAAGSWEPPFGMTVAVTTALRTLTLQAWKRYTRMVR